MKEYPDHKDFSVLEKKYRVVRMTARDGSWVIIRLMSKAVLAGISGKVTMENIHIVLPIVLDQFNEMEFRSLQEKCFNVCREWRSAGDMAVPMPLLMQDGSGRWTEKEPDLVTALSIMVNALVFNLEPFFDEAVLAELTRSLPGMLDVPPKSPTQNSTPTK